MSSKAKTQPDTRLIREYDTEPLAKGQKSQLHMLGYKLEDIIQFTVPEALAILATRSAKPGSKAWMKANAEKLAAAGLSIPPGMEAHSDEAIEERNSALPQASGVEVTRDEFTNQCLAASGVESYQMNEYTGQMTRSSDPLNEQLLAMEERFCVYKDGFDREGRSIKIRVPQRRFRWAHKDDPAEVGPKPEPVYDGRSELVRNGELFMVWMPADVWKEGRQEPQLARSRAMTGAIEKKGKEGRDDQMQGTDESGPVREGLLEMGRSEANYAA